jgi:hypothetical protein
MSAPRLCYFAALILAAPATAAAIGYSTDSNEVNVRARLIRAQTIMQKLEEALPGSTESSVALTRLAWHNWVNAGYVPPTRIPWNNAWANAAVPWGNGFANAPAHVTTPWNNWTNWHNVAWNNGGAAANPWLNATPTGRPGEVCSVGLGCSTPQAAPTGPTYSEGQTYFPSNPTFEVPGE